MEVLGLRRSQSLRTLSGAHERSWVTPAPTQWERKSVSQLVQHYQSCAELQISAQAEHKLQVSESSAERQWRRLSSVDRQGPGRNVNLSRSHSMDYLPQREVSGTKELCALFESKANRQHSFSSNPQLAATGSKTREDCPLQDWRYNKTPLKDTVIQVEEGKATNGHLESYDRASRHSHENKNRPSLIERGTAVKQGRDRISTSSSVRDRSVLYLSRAAAINPTGGSTPAEFTEKKGAKAKPSKMADKPRQITVSQSPHDDDNLPLPPPPPIPPRPLDYEGTSAISSLPVPPPKETFSTFYQQRQKSELKRLFKHIHPELRSSLDDVVDDEIMKAVQSEDSQSADAAYQGEVQSMRWIFENWTLDNIGDPHATKKLLDEEDLKGGDVRGTSCMFEQADSMQQVSGAFAQRQTSVKGDVRTSRWLFETQPLDSLNKAIPEEGELVEAVLKEPIQPGDVRGTRLLFESKPLSDLGRCNSIEDQNFLTLKSEIQEQKGDVQRTVRVFQAEPCCAIRDNSGIIHEVKSICREEIKSNNTRSARWLFETQPLDMIHKGMAEVKIIRGISLEEGQKGGVDRKRWMFETQSFDTIQEFVGVDRFEGMASECTREGDVMNKQKLFETQPLATLKGDKAEPSLEKEEIIGGDVKTSLWLFETQQMDALNHSCQVGHLAKITLSNDEHGAVKDKKQVFESSTIQKNISIQEQEIEKGDVKRFKHLFETIPLSKITQSDEAYMINEKKQEIAAGNVKGNTALFEMTPLYALKDCSGNLHEVTTVSREESIKGKVQNYKWMFETKPLDNIGQEVRNVEVIKGITREEDTMGDVKMAKWLFETQTIDGIHSKFNPSEQDTSVNKETHRGDVKTCKWLFETHPMDILYDKSENKQDKENINSTTSVKSITWLFESQPLDSMTDKHEYNLKLCTTTQDSVKSEIGVQTTKHLFETETLDRISKIPNPDKYVRCVSEVDIQSGDVSRVKELFESQSLDEIGSEMVTVSDEQNQDEHIEKGSVHKVTWLFENCPMNLINKDNDDANMQRSSEVEGGDVINKKFIFETCSLDKIQDQNFEQKSACVEKPVTNVDVKSSTMMFESLPLYAIRDKEGEFHEVTTVKKEEILSGDVRGARWMFETKPLDAIKAENEVYVIRAVTQEDAKKGDVKSARWKFETQPLDSFTDKEEPSVRVTEDFGSSNVQVNKQTFESDQSSRRFVRTVSVTDVQRGDVRTSTWLFENQTIDSLKGEPQEQNVVNTVHREDTCKGDVKRCTWLFESQPLDKIKDPDDSSVQGVEEAIPKADVKCTTWLFETTPLDKITGKSASDTLSYLDQMNFIHSSGIIIEAIESSNVNMAKYLFRNNEGIETQKEEAVEGNIRNIILQLLFKPNLKPQVTLLREVEKGEINTSVVELPEYESASTVSINRDQRIQSIVQVIDDLLVYDKNSKKGIIMQETAEGHAEMSVYSLIEAESHVIERGDVKSTIGNLLATASHKTETTCRVDENEKGNVNLFKSCIEKGDLQYLKSLHTELCADEGDSLLAPIEIVQGDVKEAKRSLYQQKEDVQRTISDVLPGDVRNTKKVFSSECSFSVEKCIPKDEIISGDVSTVKQQLATKQPVMVEKEEVVAGDIKATMESLERAKQQSMSMEREIIVPGTIYDMELSAQGPETEGNQAQKEIIISGDVKAAKKSLEMAKKQSMHVDREAIVPGKIYNLNVSGQEESPSPVAQSVSLSSPKGQHITNPKVSAAVKDQRSNVSFTACHQREIAQSAAIGSSCAADSLASFVSYECNGHIVQDEAEDMYRGDVKAAIRSLQSAATEQKLLDKEDIVRGNVQLALQSLGKHSVNVTKGDFNAAMIYRNSGKAYSGRTKTVHKQCTEVCMPPSHTKLFPSISVTAGEPPAITRQNSTPKALAKENAEPSSSEGVSSPPCPQKTNRNKPQDQKPTLPLKPQWTKLMVANKQNILPTSTPETPFLIKDNTKSAAILPKLLLRQTSPTCDTEKLPDHTTQNQLSSKNIYETSQTAEESNQTNECLPVDSQSTLHTGNPSSSEHHMDVKITSNSTEEEVDRNVVQKINAATEIQMCSKSIPEAGAQEMSMNFLTTEQNLERRDSNSSNKTTTQQSDCQPLNISAHHAQKNNLTEKQHKFDDGVVLREKKVKESETERLHRLSVHKEEIMKGNVKAAMEIFENLRKREELKEVLSQVREIEGETSKVDVCSLKTLYENVPAWIPTRNAKHQKTEEKRIEVETKDEDLESISSVETAFEDLEKASKEIMNLKEETLAKLADIEEAIKKALYSVSSLKSEADIAGLSGLFHESLKSEQPANNIRKISIVSSKTKSGQTNETADVKAVSNTTSAEQGTQRNAHIKPLVRQSSSQSSPSFISIHSAARKPAEQLKTSSTVQPKTESNPQSSCGIDQGQESAAQRQVSILQVKTGPDPSVGLIGTKTVSETYEETDGFGNVFVSSVTSTFVTKQADAKTPALFEAEQSPARYEGMTSNFQQRSARPFEDHVLQNEKGTVFVTFSPSIEKH